MTVLIVDDNEYLVEFIAAVLEDEGFDAHGFTSPEQALAWLRESGIRPRLLITDFNLPRMNGYQLHGAVRELVPEIRTLVISGRQVESEIGGLAFVQKPFTPDALLMALQSLTSEAGLSRA